MIGWLRGTIVRRAPAAGIVIVEAQGVGWELHVSIQTLAGVPGEGEDVELWVHTNVREDAIQLFGFASERERQVFRMLTSVPKVGPRNAVAVLGGFPVGELIECISAGESAKLVKIPGIGKKTAEQIVLTLGDKMVDLLEHVRLEGGAGPAQTQLPQAPAPVGAELGGPAREVLLSLGWKPKPVDKALAQALDELPEDDVALDLDGLVRATLAKLMER